MLCKTRLVSLRLTRTRRRLFLTTVDCANLSLCHDRISNNDGKTTFSPTIAESRTPKNGNARSFGLLAFRTPRLPRFTFCATAEIET